MPKNQYDPRRHAQLAEAEKLRRAWQSNGLTRTFGRALTRLNRPVGWTQPNEPLDVAKTQVLLDAAGHDDVARTDGPTGWGDYSLAASLEGFQKANNLKVDGYANPDGETMRALAPYAQRIAAKEGDGDAPKDPPKDDKPKPPPPSQPPANPPAVEKPDGEKPKEPGKGTVDDPCRDLWLIRERELEKLEPLREAALLKSDDVKRRTEAIANLKQDKLPAAVTVMRGLGQLTPATRAALKLLDAAVAAKQSLENSRKESILPRLEAELKSASEELKVLKEKLAVVERDAQGAWEAFCSCRKRHGFRC